MLKYLKYDIMTAKAGLKHQSYNLKTLFAEAYLSGRIPVISPMILYGKHNFGRTLYTDLSDYFDLKETSVMGKKSDPVFEKDINTKPHVIHMGDSLPEKAEYVVRSFPKSEGCSWKYLQTPFSIYYDVQLTYQKEISIISKPVMDILENYTCVHVRRGDVIKLKKWRLFFDTRPKNILRKLLELGSGKKVYIMSNEHPDFFRFGKNDFEFFFYTDFPSLVQIQKVDNYKLFCIESYIMEQAMLRLSTFKDDNPLYHGSLSEVLF